MLKIKHEVDLKELENFGYNRYMYFSQNGHYYGRGRIHIDEKTRTIEIPTQTRLVIEDFVIDLIQAGLVEKVEG